MKLHERFEKNGILEATNLGKWFDKTPSEDGCITDLIDKFDWGYNAKKEMEDEPREFRETEDVTIALKEDKKYYNDEIDEADASKSKIIEKIVYTGEWKNVIKNVDVLPDGRGVLEIHYQDNGDKKQMVDFFIGHFAGGKKDGVILEFKLRPKGDPKTCCKETEGKFYEAGEEKPGTD